MEKVLAGKKIATGASRKTEEWGALIEKQGGIPLVRSLQGTVFLAEEESKNELRNLIAEGVDWAIFTTGMGLDALVRLAEECDLHAPFMRLLQQANVAARGYKTYAALKKLDIKPVAVDDDGTTKGLVRALESFDFTGQRVAVQLHGETAPALARFFAERGASVTYLLPYRHIAPPAESVEQVCQELSAGQIDAICFTSAVQVRFLFEYARQAGHVDQIKHAFEQSSLAVAVGKLTAEALEEEGITRIVVPEIERMGAMVIELVRYYEALHIE